MRTPAFLVGVLFLLCAPVCRGVPGDALAWWWFDPSRFASAGVEEGGARVGAQDVVLGGLRAAVSSGVFGDGTPSVILEGLLAAGEIGEVAHTLCLLDFKAHREDGYKTMVIERCQMVLELRTGENHAEYLRTLKAIVVDAERAKSAEEIAGAQRRLDLPGGVVGVAYRAGHWDGWREVSWASLPDRFLVGLGPGALEKWLTSESGAGGAWGEHEGMVEADRPAGERCLGAFVDIAGLERVFPNAFIGGRSKRMRSVLGLAEAESVMVHARFVEQTDGIPALLALDVTVDGATGMERRGLSESVWVGRDEAGLAAPSGSYIVLSRVEWGEFFAWALEVYRATIKDLDLAEFDRERDAWLEAHGGELEALLGSLRGWLVVSDVPAPSWAVPGLATLYFPGRAGSDVALMQRGMERVLRVFQESVQRRVGEGGPMWALKIDRRGLVQMPVWGIARGQDGAVLIGGWSPRVIEENRRLIERE